MIERGGVQDSRGVDDLVASGHDHRVVGGELGDGAHARLDLSVAARAFAVDRGVPLKGAGGAVRREGKSGAVGDSGPETGEDKGVAVDGPLGLRRELPVDGVLGELGGLVGTGCEKRSENFTRDDVN